VTAYLIRRVIEAIPVLLGISIISFLVVRLAPGDPTALLADLSLLSEAERLALRESLGLEDPLPIQYAKMLGALLTGDLTSLRTGESTVKMVLDAAPTTLLLIGGTILFSLIVGVTFGVVSALRPHSRTDTVLMVLALFGLSVPSFWLGLMLIIIFAESLGWLPASGIRPQGATGVSPLDVLPYLIMPVLVLGSGIAATLMRFTRSSMLDSLGTDYVRTARSKGLTEWRVVAGHALRNSLVTIVTLVGVLIPILLSSTVVVETIFALPGMGRLAVTAALARDYPVVLTTNLLAAATVLIANLLTDVAYSLVDPRIRVHE
jgi:peptide/nickel transport system permease protein